eukprot:15441017-Alexandrium_andersonii.AAC.1
MQCGVWLLSLRGSGNRCSAKLPKNSGHSSEGWMRGNLVSVLGLSSRANPRPLRDLGTSGSAKCWRGGAFL